MKYRIVKWSYINKCGYKVERFKRFLFFKYWGDEVEELGWNCSDIVFRTTQKECEDYIELQLKLKQWHNTNV